MVVAPVLQTGGTLERMICRQYNIFCWFSQCVIPHFCKEKEKKENEQATNLQAIESSSLWRH